MVIFWMHFQVYCISCFLCHCFQISQHTGVLMTQGSPRSFGLNPKCSHTGEVEFSFGTNSIHPSVHQENIPLILKKFVASLNTFFPQLAVSLFLAVNCVYLSSTSHREQADCKRRDTKSLRGWNVDDFCNKYACKWYTEGGKIIGFIYRHFTTGQYSNYPDRPTWGYD